MENKIYGYIESKLEPEAYILGRVGGLPMEILQPDGKWMAFKPKREIQNDWGLETYNCTSFNTLAQIETYMKRKFGGEYNYSDRFVGIMAGTKPPGNDPQKIYEAIRKYGLIPDEMLPFTSDIKNAEEYYSWKGGNENACMKAGQEWLNKYNFKHEWVAANELAIEGMLRAAIQFSPLSGAVSAWSKDGDKYVRFGPDNHWTGIAYSIDDFLECLDSYDPEEKKLDLKFTFKWVKRIWIGYNTTPQQLSLISRALSLISQVIALIFPTKPVEAPVSVVNLPPVKPKPPEPIDLPKKSLLEPFCLAITQYENMALSYYNPGALRFSSYIQSLGATSERAGFAVFPNMATGEKALRSFVKAASENRLKAYHDKDILGFFQVYAPSSDNNKPELYAKFVASKCGVSIDAKMSDII